MTKKEYEAKMAALEPLEDEQRKSITCSLLCPICRANYKRLNWMDKVLTPDPFVDGGSQ